MQPNNILLCTQGASWAVIPEILGWLAPGVLDLYACLLYTSRCV